MSETNKLFADQMLLNQVKEVVLSVSKQVMTIYNNLEQSQIQIKADQSPVTAADHLAHDIICKELAKLTPNIPILSEEGEHPPFAERKHWQKFWLLDPLDGTREFINRTGEFTINVGLVENHEPTLGVVAVPALEEVYFGYKGGGSYLQTADGAITRLGGSVADRVATDRAATGSTATDSAVIDSGASVAINLINSNINDNKLSKQVGAKPSKRVGTAAAQPSLTASKLQVAVSRNFANEPELKQLLARLEPCEITLCGSTLKIGLIARGEVDVYPRFGTTYAWDTAAGQCILEEAGGSIVDFTGERLLYNTNESLVNPDFIALTNAKRLEQILISQKT